jgi:hypothetical protein
MDLFLSCNTKIGDEESFNVGFQNENFIVPICLWEDFTDFVRTNQYKIGNYVFDVEKMIAKYEKGVK